MSTDNITPNRICNNCGIEYPLTKEYFRDSDGYFRRKCRACERNAAIRYYEDNKEDVLEKKRLDRITRPEIYAARDALRVILNPEKEKQRWAIQRTKHRDKRNTNSRQWRLDNPDKVKAGNEDYYDMHHDEMLIRSRLSYNLNQPHYLMLARRGNAKRRAIMQNIEGSYTPSDLEALYDAQDGQCAYCGIRLFWDIPGDIHVDHVQPVSRGGTNNPDNLALACADCNLSKHDKTLPEWIARRNW